MSCDETREHLDEYRRGELAPDVRRAVEAHLADCVACRRVRERNDALSAMLQNLPRAPAPAALRRAIATSGNGRAATRPWLTRPWMTALVAAGAVALVLAPWVRLRSDRPADLLETLLRASVAEHQRILLETEANPGGVEDPTSLFERVRSVTGVELPPIFAGIGELRLLTARPTLLADRRTAAAALRYPASPVTTYFLLAGQDLPMPTEHRVQIEQFKPYMRRVEDFNVVYWKQGTLAYLMVSGLDVEHTRTLFLKMRKAL